MSRCKTLPIICGVTLTLGLGVYVTNAVMDGFRSHGLGTVLIALSLIGFAMWWVNRPENSAAYELGRSDAWPEAFEAGAEWGRRQAVVPLPRCGCQPQPIRRVGQRHPVEHSTKLDA
jgi:hypothetical protein